MTTIEDQLRQYGERLETIVRARSTGVPPTQRHGRRGMVAVVAVLVMVAGGTVTWTATREQQSNETDVISPPTMTTDPTVPPTVTTSVPAPSSGPGRRTSFSQVWTGSELIVFGGRSGPSSEEATDLADGFAYRPATSSWREIATAPLASSGHAVVWLAGEMVVVGGTAEAPLAYDPASDRWRRLPGPPLDGLAGSVAVAADGDLAVWSRADGAGAVFDPDTEVWTRLPQTAVGHGPARIFWTGDALVVVTADGPAVRGAVVPLDGRPASAIEPVEFNGIVDGQPTSGAPSVLRTAWVGDTLLAWSDQGEDVPARRYDVNGKQWSEVGAPPRPTAPCGSSSDPIPVGATVLAFNPCGAVWMAFDPIADRWSDSELATPFPESLRLGIPPVEPVWTGQELVGWASPFLGAAAFEPFLWRRTLPQG